MSLPAWLTAERYQSGDGFLHRRDARIKIVVTVVAAFAVTLVPEGRWLLFAAFAATVAVFVVVSRLPAGFFVRRTGLALPFIAAALPLVFTRPGETLFTLPLLGWSGSGAGAVAVLSILLKSMLAVLMASVLVGTTKPQDLLRALDRLRIPRLLSSTIMLMYRYLFVIGAEGQRMLRARDSRSARLDGYRAGRSLGWRAGVLGRMVGSLFLRSYERSERVYIAMAARGYDGSFRSVQTARALDARDWTTLLLALCAFAGLAAYGVA